MKIVGNSNNPHGGLFRSAGLFVKVTLKGGAYSGGELIREWGLICQSHFKGWELIREGA